MPEIGALRAMGFDFGTQRIGVAVGQTVSGTAEALTILPARDGQPRWDEVEALISEWQPDVLIVGDPINMDGSDSDICLRARKFARRLEGRFGIRTELVDERLSSFEAREGADRDQAIDHEAARIILQSWLARA